MLGRQQGSSALINTLVQGSGPGGGDATPMRIFCLEDACNKIAEEATLVIGTCANMPMHLLVCGFQLWEAVGTSVGAGQHSVSYMPSGSLHS